MTSTWQSQIQTQIFFSDTDGELVFAEVILQSGGKQLGETAIQLKISVMRAEQQFLQLTAVWAAGLNFSQDRETARWNWKKSTNLLL